MLKLRLYIFELRMIGILSYIKEDIHIPGRWYTKKSYIAPCDPNTDSVTS